MLRSCNLRSLARTGAANTIDPLAKEVKLNPANARVGGDLAFAVVVEEIRYWWTTITDYGEIDGGDTTCTVVGTVTNLATRTVVHRARSATCSLQGWQSAYLPQGRYRIAVAVTLDSGAKGTGEMAFTIIP